MRSALSLAKDIYRNENYKVRMHILFRAKTCPFEKIAEYVPDSSKILDLGCGNGLFVNYLSVFKPAIEATGIDISESNIAVARNTVGKRKNIRFIMGDISELTMIVGDKPQFDRILMLDSIFFLPFIQQHDAIRRSHSLLRENGLLLIKTISREALLKYWFCTLQDHIAMKFLRLYVEKQTYVLRSNDMEGLLKSVGFSGINQIDLGKRCIYPHILYICKK